MHLTTLLPQNFRDNSNTSKTYSKINNIFVECSFFQLVDANLLFELLERRQKTEFVCNKVSLCMFLSLVVLVCPLESSSFDVNVP